MVLFLRPRKDVSPFVLVEFRSGSGMRKLASIANQVELKSPTYTVQVYIQVNESESRCIVSMSQDMSSLTKEVVIMMEKGVSKSQLSHGSLGAVEYITGPCAREVVRDTK